MIRLFWTVFTQRLSLFAHCVLNLHRSYSQYDERGLVSFGCWACGDYWNRDDRGDAT